MCTAPVSGVTTVMPGFPSPEDTGAWSGAPCAAAAGWFLSARLSPPMIRTSPDSGLMRTLLSVRLLKQKPFSCSCLKQPQSLSAAESIAECELNFVRPRRTLPRSEKSSGGRPMTYPQLPSSLLSVWYRGQMNEADGALPLMLPIFLYRSSPVGFWYHLRSISLPFRLTGYTSPSPTRSGFPVTAASPTFGITTFCPASNSIVFPVSVPGSQAFPAMPGFFTKDMLLHAYIIAP